MNHENENINRKMQYILNMRPVLNKNALFSDGTRYYRNPEEPKAGEKVMLSFRTQKNNVDAVYLVSGDQKQKMKVYKTIKGLIIMGQRSSCRMRYTGTILKSIMDGSPAIITKKE